MKSAPTYLRLACLLLCMVMAGGVLAATDTEQPLTWLELILFVSISATFGGCLQAFYPTIVDSTLTRDPNGAQVPGKPQGTTTTERLFNVLIAGLFGMGGGAAAVLASIWLNKFDYSSSEANKVYLIVLGVIAGFVGHKILPKVAQGLEQRLAITEDEARRAIENAMKASREATRAETDARTAADEAVKAQNEAVKAQKLTAVIAALFHARDTRRAEQLLLELRKKDKLDGVINFNLSFLYKTQARYDEAINLMSEYLDELSRTHKDNSEEYAIALYNRACYRALKAVQDPRDIILLRDALTDLETSISRDPVNKAYAREDKDFKVLREEHNSDFYRVVGLDGP